MSQPDQHVHEALDLLECTTLLFRIDNDPEDPVRFEDIVKYEYLFSANLGVNLEEELVQAKLFVTIPVFTDENQDIQETKAGGELVLEAIYRVQKMQNWTSQSEEGLELDRNITVPVVSITYSIARGVLLTRGGGTILQDALLPIIDPSTLLTSV